MVIKAVTLGAFAAMMAFFVASTYAQTTTTTPTPMQNQTGGTSNTPSGAPNTGFGQ